MNRFYALLVTTILLLAPLAARAELVEIRPKLVEQNATVGVEYWSGESLVARSTNAAPAGVELRLPGAAWMPVVFHARTRRNGVLALGPEKIGPLTLRWRLVQKTPSLVERTLEVTASSAQQFTASFPLDFAVEGEFSSFTGPVKSRTLFGTERSRPQKETFPMAVVRTADRVFGLMAESPGLWENRCDVLVAPSPAARIAIMTGDASAPYPIYIKRQVNGQGGEDARDHYQYQMDGWQSLAAGETRRFTTWVFASPARSHYEVQLAAHLALANAKGWNRSAVEAILRNTSFYLLRRNLMRDENDRPRDGRYLFISGIGYGWKQWVSDGFYAALGLDDPEKTIEANRAIFANRMGYEDNSQYYLIWAALMKRAGGTVNPALVREAYAFIRSHEQNGIYIPPSLPGSPNPKGWKSYHDVLQYDEGDAPVSNQGFHCGALLAARELGFAVTEAEIARAIAGYRRMFNTGGGYFPTSIQQPQSLGQDTLYGATLTFAVFGRKLLTDEQVLAHYRTSEKVKSPYGLRVISQADGSLRPGDAGEYCFGGSWFLNDAANYLLAGVHGLPAAEVDARLVERIRIELAHSPAFNEDINTVTGKPHGNILYSWNSGFWWLRKEIRRRLGQTGVDPVGAAIDAQLGVVRERGVLRLEPARAKPRQ
jgi:uncharacterized protein (DUF736 family)